MGKTGQPSIYGKLKAATSMALEVKLSCQEAMEARIAFETVERLKTKLEETKTQIAQNQHDYEFDSSDDVKIDLREELMILEDIKDTLEGVLGG